MYLSRTDLKQLDEQTLLSLPKPRKDVMLCRLLSDLKEAHDRLSADSQSSSRPPSSDVPWTVAGIDDEPDDDREAASDVIPDDDEPEGTGEPDTAASADQRGSSDAGEESKRRPGRQPGAVGHSRIVTLPISATIVHRPEQCAVCGQALEP